MSQFFLRKRTFGFKTKNWLLHLHSNQIKLILLALVCPEASSAGVIQTSPLATCSAAPIQTPIFLQPQQGAVLMQHALVAPPSIPTVQHLDLLQAQTFLTNQRTASVYSQVL